MAHQPSQIRQLDLNVRRLVPRICAYEASAVRTLYEATRMAVHSSAFGATRLTKDDARKFKQQVTFGRPKEAAVKACARGKEAADSYVRQGYAILKAR